MTRLKETRHGFAVWIASALVVAMTVEALAAVLLVALNASHDLIPVEVAVNDALFALNGWLFALVGG